MTGSGDKLARGAYSASFQMPTVSQEKWDAIFGDPAKAIKKPVTKSDKKR
jgi:hypothetical protein